MPSWTDFQPFLISGLTLGGVYALSGVGMVVLFRATGVLNLAFGAVGALGALVAYQAINSWGIPQGWAWLICVLVSAVLTTVYGLVFGRALADRDPLVKATATLGLALVLLGVMDLLWTTSGGEARSITFPTDASGFNIGLNYVSWTDVIGLALGVAITAGTTLFLRFTKLGTAMRAMANDREATAMLGVPVTRVLAAAWFGCGVLSGIAGLLLADLVALDAVTLTFLVISSVAAGLIARLRSIPVTFIAAIVIGVVDAMATPINVLEPYHDMAPFVLAIAALVVLSGRRQISLERGGLQ
jgi:branched-chain amino acid transport system permease protein